MKYISRILWLLVGALFIFSGLIKINDPVGTAIKLEEYFEVFSSDFSPVFHAFIPYSLFLSILLSSLEIILGVALLVRWKLKTILISLLVLMVFFTFLTFYSAYFNKVTDCGCFGDAIKLTPWESFWKDVVLTTALVVLLVTRQYLRPFLRNTVAAAIVAASVVFSFGIGIYAYNHEPFIDFRAYKVGNNIPALMKPSAPLRYRYVMQDQQGNTKNFDDNYPTDTTLKFVRMEPLNPEAGPKITDFNVWNDEGDHTQEVFQGNKLLIVVHTVQKTKEESFAEINQLLQELEGTNVQPMVLTSSSGPDFDVFRHEVGLAAPYYYADATVLKTIIRSNPGLLLLKDGTVTGKWSRNDVPKGEEVKKLL